MSQRNRVRSEVNKGVEALRAAAVNFTDTLAGSVTYYGIIGPFEVDIDVMSVTVTPGAITTGSANTLDIFNGTAAANVPIITQFDPDTIANQVPTAKTLLGGGVTRVVAGTPITIKYVAASSGASTPNTLNVRVGYDIPVYDPTANVTSYGSYDDGI